MNHSQTVVAVMIVGVTIATLAGCTAAPAPGPSKEWSDRMSALLSDPNGQGGGGGGLGVASGSTLAHASIGLANVPSGEYDVLAVCTGTGTIHIAIKTPAPPGRVLASSDVACGATLRLPVTVVATGVLLEATSTGTYPQWQAAIVTPGWEPTPTTYSH